MSQGLYTGALIWAIAAIVITLAAGTPDIQDAIVCALYEFTWCLSNIGLQ